MTDRIADVPEAPAEAVSPSAINHLVLNVRDIDESHKFWTEIVGFKQVGELHARPDRPLPPKMRFYSAVNGSDLSATPFMVSSKMAGSDPHFDAE